MIIQALMIATVALFVFCLVLIGLLICAQLMNQFADQESALETITTVALSLSLPAAFFAPALAIALAVAVIAAVAGYAFNLHLFAD